MSFVFIYFSLIEIGLCRCVSWHCHCVITSYTKQLECLTNRGLNRSVKGIVLTRVFVHSTFAKCVLWGASTAQSGCRLSCGLGSLESFLAGARDFFFSKTSRQALMPIQPLIQWVLEVLSLRVKSQDVKLTTHLCLVLLLRMSGSPYLLLLYAFMICTGTVLLLSFITHMTFCLMET